MHANDWENCVLGCLNYVCCHDNFVEKEFIVKSNGANRLNYYVHCARKTFDITNQKYCCKIGTALSNFEIKHNCENYLSHDLNLILL